MRFIHYLLLLVVVAVISGPAPILADEVDDIVAAKSPPPGVVFEIVSGDSDLLRELLPDVQKKIKRLRKRFPGLDIAIVTHGEEQFALTDTNRENEPRVHSLAQNLVEEQQVSLHVCGTYAGWYGFSAEEFPEFVDVAAAAPAQINDYRALGYIVIILP